MFSLIVTGTPCSGPIGPRALIALSCASASSTAASPRSSTTALILPLVARMRATALSTASTAVTLRAAIASASSQALHCHSGLFRSAITRPLDLRRSSDIRSFRPSDGLVAMEGLSLLGEAEQRAPETSAPERVCEHRPPVPEYEPGALPKDNAHVTDLDP